MWRTSSRTWIRPSPRRPNKNCPMVNPAPTALMASGGRGCGQRDSRRGKVHSASVHSLVRLVRWENCFKSLFGFGAGRKFLLEYGGKVSGPGRAGEAYFLWYRQSVALMPGGHFLWTEPKEAKFASVPLDRPAQRPLRLLSLPRPVRSEKWPKGSAPPRGPFFAA